MRKNNLLSINWIIVVGVAALIVAGAIAGGVVRQASAATPRYVATTGADTGDCSDDLNPCLTIGYAIGQAASGDTINVAAGTYDEALDIDTVSGLTINGDDASTVTLAPTTTLDWDVGGYGASRQTVVRVVDSTDVVVQNMTLDFDAVKANFLFGVLYWDSTGEINDNVLENLSVADEPGSGYYEFGAYLRAPGYTDGARADIAVSGNTFIDTGRVGVNVHDYVDATIDGNTFYKTTDDFGYAIELGSASTGAITGNTIYGYDTPAASDGSTAAGIYIENAFTGGIFPLISGVTKDVVISGNEVYDSQWGMVIGNEFNDFAGDVDIDVALDGNDLHDNDDGDILISDEDKANGSSVSVHGGGNTLTSSNDVGYYIYTQGDGDVTVALTEDTITGHDTGVHLEDTHGGPDNSSYSITINESNISGNTSYGINNTIGGFTVDAEKNFWGDATGADHDSSPHGVAAAGDVVSDDVNFVPWYATETTTSASENVTVTDNPLIALSDTIQGGVQAATDGDTLDVAAGTFAEVGQIVIDKDLTIIGAGAGTTIVVPTADTSSSGDARGWFLVDPGITFNLSDVTLDGAGYKVWQAIRHKGEGTISDCAFTNIKFNESTSYAGTAIAAFGGPTMNVDVTNCTFSDIGREGVLYFGAGITGSTFSGNTYTGKGDGDFLDYAVEVGAGAVVDITNNTISDNRGVAGSDGSTSAGVLVTTFFGGGSTAAVSENFISDSTTGVSVGYDGSDTSVATVFNNSLTANGTGVVSTAPLVDASGNWWGTNTAAGLAAQVTADVDYSPWLDDGTDTDGGTAGFQGDFSVVHVDDDSPVSGAEQHIQEGVNLVSGSTVEVEPGTYTGAANIDEPLDLLCAQAGVPVGSRTEGSAAESIIDFTGSYGAIVVQSSDVLVDGCDIQGDADTNVGVYVAAGDNSFSDITLTNNFIHGMAKENTSNASVYAYGVLADAKVSESGPFGSISGLSITDSSIHDIGGVVDGAITSAGLGVSLHEISGASAGDGAVVTGNSFDTINDGWDGSAVAFGAGVSVAESGLSTSPSSGASVTGNAYADSTGGVAVFATSSSVNEANADFSNVPVLVLNIGRLAAISEGPLAPYAKSDTLTSLPLSDGYFAKIQDAIDSSDSGATVSVTEGTFTEQVVVDRDIVLAGDNPPNGGSAAVVDGTVTITGDGAKVQSLKIVPGSVSGDEAAISVYAGDTTVTGNLIDGMTGDGTGSIKGIHVYADSKPGISNITVSSNTVKNLDNQQPGVPYSGSDGIMVQGVVDDVDVIGNTVTEIHSAGWAYGVDVTTTAADPSNPPQNVHVQQNDISVVNNGSVYDVLAVPLDPPIIGVGFTLDETFPGADDGDASETTVTNNSFTDLIVGAVNKDTDEILNAELNWWDSCDGPSGVGPGSGNAVGPNVDYDPWEQGACDKDNDGLSDDQETFVYGTDPLNPDTDGDGCLDGREVLPKGLVAQGGGRDPLNPYDFYDTDGNKQVDLTGDILGVIVRWTANPTQPYDPAYDRGPTAGPNPWNMTAPDSSISLTIDILGVIAQWQHNCN